MYLICMQLTFFNINCLGVEYVKFCQVKIDTEIVQHQHISVLEQILLLVRGNILVSQDLVLFLIGEQNSVPPELSFLMFSC